MCSGSTHAPTNDLILSWLNSFNYTHKKVRRMIVYAIKDTCQSRPTLPSWRLLCWRYAMICHRSSFIRQSYHFATDIHPVLLQLMYIWTVCLNTEWAAKTFQLLTKSRAKFDSLFVNIQCATACSLENVNFKV